MTALAHTLRSLTLLAADCAAPWERHPGGNNTLTESAVEMKQDGGMTNVFPPIRNCSGCFRLSFVVTPGGRVSNWPETWLEFLCGVMKRMDGTPDTPLTADFGCARLTPALAMTIVSWGRAFTLSRWGDTLMMGEVVAVGARTSGGGGGATIDTGVPGAELLFVPFFLFCRELLTTLQAWNTHKNTV